MKAYDKEVLKRGKKEIAISIPAAIASHNVELFTSGPLGKMGLKQKAEHI